ncbi:hypothetical protein A3K73_02920 [Candidatus Pacearchaeota archaeon RBG_13_36_9]|nr:MAG: hypothetical protein A3K73_02920 [Candidatus Pacearchaeota archaeon RBG_13_36_9]
MKPQLPKEFEEMIKKRHEILLKKYLISKKKKIYKIDQYKIVVYPDVFPPFDDSLFFYKFLKKLKNPGRALDIGTGSGILSLGMQKKAKSIVSSDINKKAIKSLKETIKLNKIKNIEPRYSNIFSKINERFGTIVFNAPFMYFKPKNMLERAICDENYRDLEKFLKQVKKHLTKKGKIYLAFSNIGDTNYLRKLIKNNKLKTKLLSKKKAFPISGMNKLFYYIYEIR